MLFTKLNARLDHEFLLIFTKLKTIETKIDTLLARLESDNNPEALLSTSEINMMKSWRADVNKMNQLPHPAYDEEPDMLTKYKTNKS